MQSKHPCEQDNQLLKHALNVLATQGWGRDDNASFGYPALLYLSQRFQCPLQQAGIDIAALESEWDEMVDYAKHYLNISTEENGVIWWKLFNAPVSKEWSNILGLAELLFSLPMSNGHLERIFSQLKLIKTNRRTGLGEGRLDSLLCIVTTGPPPSEWDASGAVQLWWSDKKGRNVSDSRSQPSSISNPGCSTSTNTSSSPQPSKEQERMSSEDWENWAS